MGTCPALRVGSLFGVIYWPLRRIYLSMRTRWSMASPKHEDRLFLTVIFAA